MKRAATLLVLATLACTSTKPAEPAPANDTIPQIEAAIARDLTNKPLVYILAVNYDRANDAAGVVKSLRQLDDLGWEHGVAPHDIRNTDTPELRAIVAKLDARVPRVSRAQTAFTLANQRDLVPEGITFDPVDGVFYVSGIHRRNVLRVDRDGNATEFVKEAQDGMLGGLGVKVDAQRRLLWVISTTTPEMRGWKEGDNRSMLAAYDLRDGKLARKIDATPAMLNDLTLLADGSLFATDMGRHKVVRLTPEATALEVWAEDLSFPNGITVSEDERHLYVADFRGITRFDLQDRSKTSVRSASILSGIDGLSTHRGTLIGIQNAIGKARVIRVDPATGAVDILESGNPLFEIPTTGVAVGDEYFFIANPGLRSFDADQQIWPMEKLADPVMLKIAL
jgi:sugar lactone lactonase YvrE